MSELVDREHESQCQTIGLRKVQVINSLTQLRVQFDHLVWSLCCHAHWQRTKCNLQLRVL